MEPEQCDPEAWEPDAMMITNEESDSAVSEDTHTDASCPASLVCDYEKLERLEAAARALIEGIGEDPDREGLRDTPKRVAKAWVDVTTGYLQDLKSVIGDALFHEAVLGATAGGIVTVRDIEFASTSEESMLPFLGRCHVGYVPRGGVVLGLSKVARVVKVFACRLQSQERFTQQLLGAFEAELAPLGVAVVVEATHLVDGPEAASRFTCAASGSLSSSMGPASQFQDFMSLLRLSGVSMPLSVLPTAADQAPLGGSSGCSVSGGLLEDEEQQYFRVRNYGRGPWAPSTEHAMQLALETIIREVGDNPDRPGMRAGARRYLRWLQEATSGYSQPVGTNTALGPACLPAAPAEGHEPAAAGSAVHAAGAPAALSVDGGSSSSPIRGVQMMSIRFMSQCEHHLLPFFGEVHFGFVLGGALAGRDVEEGLRGVVQAFTRRLQIQERITHQLADAALGLVGEGGGVVVVCDAAHMCMVSRGVEKHASRTTTMAVRGVMAEDGQLRAAVLGMLTESRRTQAL